MCARFGNNCDTPLGVYHLPTSSVLLSEKCEAGVYHPPTSAMQCQKKVKPSHPPTYSPVSEKGEACKFANWPLLTSLLTTLVMQSILCL